MKEYIFDYDEWIRSGEEKAIKGELVRCRDCKYGTEMSGNIICHKPKHDEYETDIRPFDWFCADGKSRD